MNIKQLFDKNNKLTGLFSLELKGINFTMSRKELEFLILISKQVMKVRV